MSVDTDCIFVAINIFRSSEYRDLSVKLLLLWTSPLYVHKFYAPITWEKCFNFKSACLASSNLKDEGMRRVNHRCHGPHKAWSYSH